MFYIIKHDQCLNNSRFNGRKSHILLVSRSKWPECNKKYRPCYRQYSGVIIYDDNNQECETKNLVYEKDDSCFKPSYPTNDLK